MHKKVSIAVPVYNVESYLNRCIDSILNQTYKNFELILVDDGSTDSSAKICDEYAKEDTRIKVIHQQNKGLSSARNTGIEYSSGEYIMFVDSDDYVCNNFVEEMVEAIEKNNVDVVRCKAIIHRDDGSHYIENIYEREGKIYKNEDIKNFIKNIAAYSDSHICGYSWNLIIRRDKLNVKFNISAYGREDLIFFMELLLESTESIYFSDKALYHYCYNDISITKNISGCQRYVAGSIACAKIIKEILLRNELLDKRLEKNIDYTIITDDIRRLYSISSYSIFKINKNIKILLKNKELRNMIKNVNIRPLSFKAKILIILLKLRIYFFVAVYIKIKK